MVSHVAVCPAAEDKCFACGIVLSPALSAQPSDIKALHFEACPGMIDVKGEDPKGGQVGSAKKGGLVNLGRLIARTKAEGGRAVFRVKSSAGVEAALDAQERRHDQRSFPPNAATAPADPRASASTFFAVGLELGLE